jgi:ubiquinone/menaquinone biosynthesis C-methylase UbiE
MQRIKEDFVNKVAEFILLEGMSILEVGCGDGSRSAELANRCQSLIGIEPDVQLVNRANKRGIVNAKFIVGSAESLILPDHLFDLVVFTLSLHHVPIDKMSVAIDEAVRVVRQGGYIVFLEPTETGTFFDAEIRFNACDGDERKEKIAAHIAMMNHQILQTVVELDDETVFQFDSESDFIESLRPTDHLDEIKSFLQTNNHTLRAGRRINIYKSK